MSGIVLLIALGIPTAVIFVMVHRIVSRRRSLQSLPLLTAVGDYASGALACPRCRCTSFASPPAAGRDFFAFALGPFIFGAPSRRLDSVVECVACTAQFRRGLSPASSAASQVGLTAARG